VNGSAAPAMKLAIKPKPINKSSRVVAKRNNSLLNIKILCIE
jgi:hypothetical protein